MEKKILRRFFIVVFIFSNILFANNFVKSKIRLGELKLTFESEIERVTYFELPQSDGTTKYVYDVHGATLPVGKGISHHTFRTIESFRMGQHTPSILRIVIKSKERDLNRHQFSGKVLFIPLLHGLASTLEKRANSTITQKREEKVLEKEENHLSLSIEEKPRAIEEKSIEEIKEQKFESIQEETTALKETPSSPIIVIDAGHGGKDTGAICCGKKKEKRVVLSVALNLKKRLQRKGYTVYMTRDDDSFVKLPKRTEFANQKRADIFVSIHANAAPNKSVWNIFKGLEIYYLSPAKTERAKRAAAKENAVMFQGKDFYTKNAYLSLISREKIVESHKLALDVSSKMVSTLETSFGSVANSGVKTANFWVLVGAQMPAILAEIGYITHPEEGENLMNHRYRTLLAKGIAEGIERYLSHK